MLMSQALTQAWQLGFCAQRRRCCIQPCAVASDVVDALAKKVEAQCTMSFQLSAVSTEELETNK